MEDAGATFPLHIVRRKVDKTNSSFSFPGIEPPCLTAIGFPISIGQILSQFNQLLYSWQSSQTWSSRKVLRRIFWQIHGNCLLLPSLGYLIGKSLHEDFSCLV